MKKNIYLIFFSLLISFFIIEIVLRIFFPQDTSTPWKIYLEDGLLLNKNSGTAKHHFRKNNITVKYTFDRFHNRKYDFVKSKDKILILGDSYTFGWLLNDEDTYVYKLAKKFPNYEFINSASSGHGTSDQLSYFEKFCKVIKPKYTFISVNYDDIARSKSSNLYKLDKQNKLISGKNIIPKISKFVDNNKIYEFLVSNFHTIGLLRKIYSLFYYKTDINEDNNSKNLKNDNKNLNLYIFEKKLFERFKEQSINCNTNFYIINLAWFNKKEYFSTTYKFLNNNKNFFEINNIKYIDLSNKMKKKYANQEQYTISIDTHPNAKANRLYFEILYEKFKMILN